MPQLRTLCRLIGYKAYLKGKVQSVKGQGRDANGCRAMYYSSRLGVVEKS